MRLPLSTLTLLIVCAGPTVLSASASAQENRVIVREQRVVLVRSGRLAKEFPARRRAIVKYPVVNGLSNPVVLRKVRQLLTLKNLFDCSLEDYRQDSWLTDFGYQVNYNKNHIFDITFSQSGIGAYPDTQTKHFLINLKSGEVIKAADAFTSGSLATLATMVNQKLRAETERIMKSVETEKDVEANEKSSLKEQLDQLRFDLANLDEFSVSDRGVTFLFDAGFPHVIKALEPDGRYLLTYAELRRYIKRNGPLGIFT